MQINKRVSVYWSWHDFIIGAVWDRDRRTLYLHLLFAWAAIIIQSEERKTT